MSDYSTLRFANGRTAINVRTVGELKRAISELPDDIPCKISFEDSVDVVLFNVTSDVERHLSFSDCMLDEDEIAEDMAKGTT